jgi:putative lipoic acid-binding regulatory protein
MAMGPDERDRALALLRDQHAFPGEFNFRVVAHPSRRTIIVSAVAAAAGGGEALVDVTERSSRQGNYLALHIKVLVADAEVVLDVYEVLKGVDGVLTVM